MSFRTPRPADRTVYWADAKEESSPVSSTARSLRASALEPSVRMSPFMTRLLAAGGQDKPVRPRSPTQRDAGDGVSLART
ncbi:MAG: hypothetical protein P4L40_15430, partial [Terracidiphilus sp.]|nr:hypothetical protein [Terracidiphilus sp.]